MANRYWHKFQEYQPLMDHVASFNLDSFPAILMEVTGSQASRGLMKASHPSWILMVAPRIASVEVACGPKPLEDLDKALAIITEHSSHSKKVKVKYGAWVVERILLTNE